jgi:hypothetical protein
MARGDGGKVIFENDEDRKSFLFRLDQVCGSHGWRVHAWVLMNNHFHLLLETPEANLVTGMKYLLGTFSQGEESAGVMPLCLQLAHGKLVLYLPYFA